ncbi:MAG: aminotransferase class IV [Streptococcaceae bacterium]|jgi:D-alanine transaminase|nr:aminotransferase class IV [Streptococcaceae bacterium]
MKALAYYNGQISDIDELVVPFNDRSHFFGDGVYDATIASHHHVYLLNEHLERFFNSMALVDINPNFTKEWLKELLIDLTQRLDTGEKFVYFQVSRGTAPRKHTYDSSITPNLLIYLEPLLLEVEQILLTPIDVQIEPDVRFELCHIKTLNLLPNVLSSQRASLKGYEETIYHRNERVTECAHSNVHIIQNGVLKTAPTDHWILPGIARHHLLLACQKLEIAYEEVAFTLDELFNADEVIITSSSNLCTQVKTIDGIPVGARATDLLKELQSAVYQEYIAAINSGKNA